MHSIRPAAGIFVCTILLILAGSTTVQTQPPGPPLPAKYRVILRYDIPSPRDHHVALYKAMVTDLAKIGFEFEPKLKPFPNTDYEDPTKNTLSGLIAPAKALDCLNIPSVASLLLVPTTYQLPDDPTAPVHVRLELAKGLSPTRQVILANQVKALLEQLDFKESVGYDDSGYTGRPHTRIVGTIPAENLTTLLKDLRTQPSGWLAPRIEAGTLPTPVNQVSPILVTEVIPEPAPPRDAPKAAPRGQSYLDKITPSLWAMLTGKDEDTKIVRAEVILSYVPTDDDESYREALMKEAPSIVFEGRLGPVVTVLLRVNQASGLAGLPQVSVVRLARPSLVKVDPSVTFTGDNGQALALSGMADLHLRGFKGQGKRIAIIDSDFRGYEALVHSGKLNQATRLLDLTAEFNPDLLPDPPANDDARAIGHGTHCALAAALAAPEAELTLVRIDPASLHQVKLIAKAVNGESVFDDLLTQRFDDLRTSAQNMSRRREEIADERKPILDNFADESELKRIYEILGPAVRGWLFTQREWSYLRVQELERDNELQRQLQSRFQQLYDGLGRLNGTQVVCTSLVWNDGYPLGGGSPLSQWFDQQPLHKAIWMVATGNTRGQTWTGPYRDRDGTGVMEFLPPGIKLPSGAWSSELNFLAWQPHVGAPATMLPEGVKVRVTMQWREPHDSSYYWNPKERDRYLKPLADLGLVVLRQRDPMGTILPADDFEVAARSPVPAFRIENHPNSSTYEQLVEFAVEKTGRFALRVERQGPGRWTVLTDPATNQALLVEKQGYAGSGVRPADAPNLPALETKWELRPRIFVTVYDPITAAKGRAVLSDYFTNAGSIPLLADTRALISIGAIDMAGQPEPFSAVGTPGTLWNFRKPNVSTHDGLILTAPGNGSAFGTSLATPFAAGMAATLTSAGLRPQVLQAELQRLQCAPWPMRK